jgi:hypothetical protein
LQGKILPATGVNRGFLLFFRVEQGNPVLSAPPSLGRGWQARRTREVT